MYYLNITEPLLEQRLCFAVSIVVFLSGFCKLLKRLWHRQFSQLNIYLKEVAISSFSMEPSQNHNFVQFHSPEYGNEDHGSESQGFKKEPSGHANASLKSPDITFSEAKPVHNYSIQTGEEFALEFMRDRVNPRKDIPNNSGDSNHAPRYMELKGISHTGSESGSDISMVATTEKDSREFAQKNTSLHVDKANDGSLQYMQSNYNSHRVLSYTSSGASDSSSTKLKILCSFGGRILPRPSDCKLRYVGGETRIVRISKDITWRELWQKTTAIYDETAAIKYQLPGEDLDALVSISSDEDLLNMMEECNLLEDGKESKKLRMFLFSPADLDEAHFSLANPHGDSEMKYVVAVNGMDLGSRKGSALCGLASSFGNNLNELDRLNVDRDTSRIATGFVGVSNSNLVGFVAPPTLIEPSAATVSISSKAYETDMRFFHGQTVHNDQERHYPSQFGYNFHSPYYSPSESAVPQSSYGLISEQKDLEGKYVNALGPVSEPKGLEGKPLNSSDTVFTGPQEKEAKLKVEDLIQTESEESSVMVVPKLDREFSSKDSNGKGKPEEPMQVPKPLDAVMSSGLPSSNGNEYFTSGNDPVPESVSESNPTDLSYFESSIPPQRVYRSEWIPREQLELLSRISKSDDSHNSQFLVNQSQNDTSQHELVAASVENLQQGNVDIPAEQSVSIERSSHQEQETFDNGLTRTPKLKQTDPLEVGDSMHENYVIKAETELVLKLHNRSLEDSSAVSNEDSVKYPEDSRIHCVDEVGSQSIANDGYGLPQSSTWIGTREEPNVDAPKTKQADILIDINDRFPRDLLSDIFSRAVLSDGSSDFGPSLQNDGAGLSVNIENHDPKHWSFFQKLAGDQFTRRDVSLIDQDHVMFSPGLTKVEEEAPLAYDFVPLTRDGILPNRGVQEKYGEDGQKDGAVSTAIHSDYNVSRMNVSEGMQYDDLIDNRIRDSEYEDGFGIVGLPLLDPSLVDFDISSLQIIKNADLEELRELGSGTFGTVYHGKWRGSDVAIKRIKKSCFTGRQSEQERLTIEFWREAEILSKLHHPNVVAFYGVVQDGPGGTLATVTEYMVDGSLRHVLVRKDRNLDRRKRLMIAMDAAFGMEYLHSKNIVHFDLKCDNLLVNLKDPSRPICKVGDFGLSKIKRNTLVSGGVRGTLPWMAPELLNGSSNKVSEKVDVFSFGIVLWEILTGEEPYANMHYGAIIGGIVNNTLRPTIPSYCDSEWRILMEQCWAPNPALRPSFTEITNRLRVMTTPSPQTRKTGS
ncbi:hypothetical protein ABFS82_08G160300 [Erythranthe guttata]